LDLLLLHNRWKFILVMGIRVATYNLGSKNENPFKYVVNEDELPKTYALQKVTLSIIHKDKRPVEEIVGPFKNIPWLIIDKDNSNLVNSLLRKRFYNAWEIICQQEMYEDVMELFPWGDRKYEPSDTTIFEAIPAHRKSIPVLWGTWILVRCFWYYMPYLDLLEAKKEILQKPSMIRQTVNQITEIMANVDVLFLQELTADVEEIIQETRDDLKIISNLSDIEVTRGCAIVYHAETDMVLKDYQIRSNMVKIVTAVGRKNYHLTSMESNVSAQDLCDCDFFNHWSEGYHVVGGYFDCGKSVFDTDYLRVFMKIKKHGLCAPNRGVSTEPAIYSSIQSDQSVAGKQTGKQSSLIMTNAKRIGDILVDAPKEKQVPTLKHMSHHAVVSVHVKWK